VQVSEIDSDGVRRRLRVIVEAERVEHALAERAEAMARTARVPGFRPGAVPAHVIRRRFARKLRDEVLAQLLAETSREVLAGLDRAPLTRPGLTVESAEPGAALCYLITVDVVPDVDLAPLDDIALVRDAAEIADADVDAALARIAPSTMDAETLARERGFASIALLRTALRDDLAQRAARVADTRLKRRLLDFIAQRFELAAPRELIETEIARIRELAAADGATQDGLAEDEIERIAERRIRVGLVIAAYAARERITISDEEVYDAAGREAARHPGREAELLERVRGDASARGAMRAAMLEGKAVRRLLGRARIAPHVTTFAALMDADDTGD
jgi:FKBP-type peptidyl-prolyl cis-trans isomerase (trigger factor)